MIPNEVIDRIKERADIVDVARTFIELKKRGNDFWACCPFHREKTPSFKLNEERQGYYCFGCKEHGNAIDFVKKMLNTDFVGALRWLAEKYGIEIPENGPQENPDEARRIRSIRDRRLSLLSEVAKWYQTLLNQPQAEQARRYLEGRGIDQWAVTTFGLGYSPDGWDGVIRWAATLGYTEEDLVATGLVTRRDDASRYHDIFRNRLMFPICNDMGKVVGFSARVLDKDSATAKYVNTPETEFFQKGRLLYGLHLARTAFRDFGHALICEGQLDVIACHRAGLANAVAAQGTAFTENHARMLAKSVRRVLLSFDADTAGYKAAERTITLLHAEGLDVGVITLPNGEDPDSVFRIGGAEALRKMMSPSVAEEAVPYLFRIACLSDDINRPEGKSIIVNRVLRAVKPMKDEIVRVGHCQWLAQKMNLPESVIINALNALPDPNAVRRPIAAGPVQANVHQMPPAFRMKPKEDSNWTLLLDLILHIETYARELSYMEDMTSLIPNTPVGMAINQVLVMTSQEEWSHAVEALSSGPLFQDETVGRCLLASQCNESLSIEPDEVNRRAFNDCLARIRIQAVSTQIQECQTQLATSTDKVTREELMKKTADLVRRKTELRRDLQG